MRDLQKVLAGELTGLVMEMLGTDSKSIATRTVKSAFPTVEIDKRSGEYINLRRSISFHTTLLSIP